LTSGQDEPVLNTTKDAHVQELMKYAEKHVMDMEFNAIFSHSALAARLKYPPAESTVTREVLIGSKLKKKRKATALRILESQSPKAAKRKPLVLSSDKPLSRAEGEKLYESFQEEVPEPSTESLTPSPKRQKQTTEVSREETSGPLELIITQPFFCQSASSYRKHRSSFSKQTQANLLSVPAHKFFLPNKSIAPERQGKKREKTKWGTMCLQL
jgi:hypothetical protein